MQEQLWQFPLCSILQKLITNKLNLKIASLKTFYCRYPNPIKLHFFFFSISRFLSGSIAPTSPNASWATSFSPFLVFFCFTRYKNWQQLNHHFWVKSIKQLESSRSMHFIYYKKKIKKLWEKILWSCTKQVESVIKSDWDTFDVLKPFSQSGKQRRKMTHSDNEGTKHQVGNS